MLRPVLYVNIHRHTHAD